MGKSDHATLLINTTISYVSTPVLPKPDFNKGDYASFRALVSCNWDDEFMSCINDVDEMWLKFKNKLEEGMTAYVPLVKPFFTTAKRSKPLHEDIRKEIRLKNSLWNRPGSSRILVDSPSKK